MITLVLLALALLLFVYGERVSQSRRPLDYAASLEEAVVRVNGTSLTLRQLAYYVALEEAQVQEQAMIYDPEEPSKYWNVQVGGVFVRNAARNAVIQMAVHDVIFAELAEAEGVELSEEEEEALLSAQEAFWEDLVEDEKAPRLGVSFEDIGESMRRAALAQKYQAVYELVRGKEAGAYDFGEEAFEELLKKQEYKVDKELWRRVDFGHVTIVQE
ncbi:MAG: hypothetical protein NC355_01210 [Blautia sp.]|nr:hypothetical protein [Blautia sp.]